MVSDVRTRAIEETTLKSEHRFWQNAGRTYFANPRETRASIDDSSGRRTPEPLDIVVCLTSGNDLE